VAAGVIVAGTGFESLTCSPRAPAAIAFVCAPHPTTHTGDKKGHWIGILLLIASVTITSIRRAVTQHIFQRSRPESAFKQRTKLQMLPFVSIGTVVTSFLLAGILEHQAYEKIMEIHTLGSIALPAAVVSLCIMILTISELVIVSITTATIMAVLTVIHTIFSVLAGVLRQHDQVFRNQWIGFGICSVGSAMYFYARSRDEDQPKSFQHDADSQDVSAGSIILSQSMGHDG
jgi:drug/metabolite transporter (DMT)-like permease